MSISSLTNRNDYVGNGATATYAYGFKAYLSSELRVTVVNTAGVETRLTLTTDYTVTGVGANGGGNIVLVSAAQAWLTGGFLTSSFGLTVRRVRALTQLADIRNQGEFYPETHEDVFDKLVMTQQQLQDELDRAVRLPETEAGSATFVLPTLATRANQLLGFNASGTPIAAAAVSATVSSFMQTVLDDLTAAAALTTLGVTTFAQTVLDDATAPIARTTLGHGHTTTGDIEYASSATALARLAIGTAGQRLGVSSGALPQWQDDPAPNSIINGNFDFWQRGASLAAVSNGGYQADRWQYVRATSSAVHTYSRSTDVPTLAQSSFQSSYSALLDCTTADAAVAAGDLVAFRQQMEGYTWAGIRGKTLTLSFWVKATKTGTYCVSFMNSGNDRSYVAEYTVSVTDTWEKKTITVAFNPTAGTDDYTTGAGIKLSFTLMAGTTYQTTAGAWQTGEFFGTSNQVNACDTLSNKLRVAQVKLELGSNATAFQRIGQNIVEELVMCQRYYEKSYNPDVALQTVTDAGCVIFYPRAGTQSVPCRFAVQKRINPTMAYYSTLDGAVNLVHDVSAGVNRTVNSYGRIGMGGATAVTAAMADGNLSTFHFTAEAEF